jgi:hypothetical protein
MSRAHNRAGGASAKGQIAIAQAAVSLGTNAHYSGLPPSCNVLKSFGIPGSQLSSNNHPVQPTRRALKMDYLRAPLMVRRLRHLNGNADFEPQMTEELEVLICHISGTRQ